MARFHADAPASDELPRPCRCRAWPERALAAARDRGADLVARPRTCSRAPDRAGRSRTAGGGARGRAAADRLGRTVAGSSSCAAAAQQRPGAAVLIAVGAARADRPDAAAGHGVEPRGRGTSAGADRPRRRVAGARRARRKPLGAERRLARPGWIWIVLVVPLSGTSAYLSRLSGTPPLHIWTASLEPDGRRSCFGRSSPRARSPPRRCGRSRLSRCPGCCGADRWSLDTCLVVVWSATLVSATGAAISIAHAGTTQPTERTALIGAIAGAMIALAPSVRERLRTGRDPAGVP